MIIYLAFHLTFFLLFLHSVIAANGNCPPLTYKRFQSILSTCEQPHQPCETVTSQLVKNVSTPIADNHDDRFSVPSLDELGLCFLYFIICIFYVISNICIALNPSSIYLDSKRLCIFVKISLNVLLFLKDRIYSYIKDLHN